MNTNETRRDDVTIETDKYSFTVPEGHEQAGLKVVKQFDFEVCQSPEAAQHMLDTREWDIVELVNDKLKRNARSTSYQKSTLPYKPNDRTPEQQRDRAIRAMIAAGLSEDVATAQFDALIAAQ